VKRIIQTVKSSFPRRLVSCRGTSTTLFYWEKLFSLSSSPIKQFLLAESPIFTGEDLTAKEKQPVAYTGYFSFIIQTHLSENAGTKMSDIDNAIKLTNQVKPSNQADDAITVVVPQQLH
jgi:hypothetical protein